MNYDIAIATRNRPEALKLSIPLFLNQSEKPYSIIIVDSSDEPQKVYDVVTAMAVKSAVPIKFFQSKPSSSLQRNIALKHVSCPVVMFPDDDSLWWPEVGRSIMDIYRNDKKGDIGGVCGRETSKIPFGVSLSRDVIPYKMTRADVFRQKIAKRRHALEKFLMPDPLWIHGRSFWENRQQPEFLNQFDTALVEFMGGFRMTFRTDVIKKYGFDEDLGAFLGYAAYEDADASFKVLKDNKFLVGAHQAHVYHYKSPNLRANGFALGFMLLFNRTYVICKHSPLDSPARLKLRKFALYKGLQYVLACSTEFGRDRLLGTFCAFKNIPELLNAPDELLREKYLTVCERVLGNQ